MSSLSSLARKYNAQIRGLEASEFRAHEVFCLDRFERTVHFCAPQEIAGQMAQLEAWWDSQAAEMRRDQSLLYLALAKLYYGLIAIHPFADGNQRTTCRVIQHMAEEMGYQVHSLELLRKILLKGEVHEEIRQLRLLFLHILKPAPGPSRERTGKSTQPGKAEAGLEFYPS